MISPSVHKLVEDELQKALQREAEEQDVVNTQAQHLEALKARYVRMCVCSSGQ